jgi:GDPmannose 4,6-dehydratase
MWLMLQQAEPDDYVVATGETRSVREFAEKVFARLDMPLEWQGAGVHEKGIDTKTGKIVIEVDTKYFRPAEVELLLGDSTKAQTKMGWKPKTDLDGLVAMMTDSDLELAEREKRSNG